MVIIFLKTRMDSTNNKKKRERERMEHVPWVNICRRKQEKVSRCQPKKKFTKQSERENERSEKKKNFENSKTHKFQIQNAFCSFRFLSLVLSHLIIISKEEEKGTSSKHFTHQ
jgi:hypothetical protein